MEHTLKENLLHVGLCETIRMHILSIEYKNELKFKRALLRNMLLNKLWKPPKTARLVQTETNHHNNL